MFKERNHRNHWIARNLMIVGLFGSAPVAAQPDDAPFRQAPADNRPAAYMPRGVSLEHRFFEATDWVFYQSISELPPDLRAILFLVAGPSVVGAGASFNTGDTLEYPSSSQHQYTAVAGDLVVLVWYTASFSGPMLRAILHDRTADDACRYGWSATAGPVPPTLTRLLAFIKAKESAASRCEYLAPSDTF
jgi:hypothetical protein